MTSPIVRSALFVPATRPDRIPKAITSGADRVIVDLEDAVEEKLKVQARDNLDRFLSENPDSKVLVRVNGPEHWAHTADLEVCQHHSSVSAIMLPKAESGDQVANAHATGKPVWPIIESARGVVRIEQIAAEKGVERLLFGSLDFGLDISLRMGTPAAEQVLSHARYAVILHNRLAGLAPALDGVFPDIRDLQGLRSAVENARDMGFGGTLCIHPSQVEIIHSALKPSPDEVAWARRVLEAAESEGGVFVLDGQMVDAPVIGRAKSILLYERQ